jgi:hypothetical protein
MAYNSKEIWIPCDKQAQSIAASGTGTMTPVQVGGLGGIPVPDGTSNIPKGLCYGYHIKASAAHATNEEVPVKLYDAASGDLLYSTKADLKGSTEEVDTLATPIPFFDTPYFQIGPVGASGGAKTFTIRFFFKALA